MYKKKKNGSNTEENCGRKDKYKISRWQNLLEAEITSLSLKYENYEIIMV